MKSLAIVATHPVQYYAPLYRVLAREPGLELKVFYHHLPCDRDQGVEFGKPFQWDVDLLSGYTHAEGPAAISGLLDELLAHRWTAILVHGWSDSFSRKVIGRAWRTHTPIMVRGDSHLHTPRPLWRRWMKYPLYRYLLPRFSACLAVGTWSAQYYRHYGVPNEKIMMSPHCIDTERFAGQAASLRPLRAMIRSTWSLADDDFVFLYVGRLSSTKRVQDFIAALARCSESRVRIHGLIIGEGSLRESLERQAKQCFAPIRFAGFLNQSEVARAYAAADCLVLSSSGEETWGLVVNEAMTCGIPCLVSDQVGCGVDLIIPGINGMIFPCGDITRLSDLMCEVAEGRLRLDPAHPRSLEILKGHSCNTAARGVLEAMELFKV